MAGRYGGLMEYGLLAIEFFPDLSVDEIREGQLLALTFGLPFAVIVQLVLWIGL
ncbi:hypothetical protein [Bradyrhizobium iriomotense]|uniref:hypothetical protein n=1 Tax=Bradyrhizobium iriomotense TaxID=441950 RepID=UPI001B8A3355|nr:hypothetical protein [Bradyrhizobium iriomotense]MBR1130834.1 hypothetical protein [Bradyrhizobium iriomotense]